MNMKTITDRVEEFEKAKKDGKLTWQDYGCDGATECCGNCGRERMNDIGVKNFLTTALIQLHNDILDEAEKRIEARMGMPTTSRYDDIATINQLKKEV